MKKFLFFLLIAALLGAGGYKGYSKFVRKSQTQVLETARVERGDIRGALVETGIIKPQVGALVKIGSRITGIILKMNVKIGDNVKQGDLIALIDDREIRKSIERQQAALQSARNTLTQVELTYPSRIQEAQATLEYARVDLDREKELLRHEYTTKASVDKASSQFRVADATLKRLRDESRTEREISKSKIVEIEAQIRQLEVNLSYTEIFTPIDGVVADVTTQEGETIVTGLQVANLVTILDPTRLEMWVYVDETDIGRVKLAQAVEYYVDTFPDRLFHGTIGKIHPQPVTKDNIVYFLAIAEVPVEDASLLKSDMTTHVKVIYEEKKEILTVPNAAVKFEEGKQIAYRVLGEGKVEKAELKTGIRGEDKTEVITGIKEGEEIATKIILPVAQKP